jgi:REP element-mobilizing transposase RayT
MSKMQQRSLEYPEWGGARRGAGRKRSSSRPCVQHGPRPKLSKHVPVHVTLRLAPGQPTLRQGRSHRVLLDALSAAAEKHGVRILHYSALSNHVHLVCEAEDAQSLSRGVQGLCVRIARALNRLWNRAGSVFADRFHSRQLRTPREVRNALKYLLLNARHHGIHLVGGVDPYSSGSWFDGWTRRSPAFEAAMRHFPLARARTWLMTTGWKKGGLLDRSG